MNRVVSGVVAGDTVDYVARGSQTSTFAVMLQVTSGTATLRVFDPDYPKVVIASITISADSLPLGRHLIPRIVVPSLDGIHIHVAGRAEYRFQIYLPSDDPERITSRVAIGDTVIGEDIAPESDLDAFVFSGKRGDELIGYVQALDTKSGGGVQLAVFGVGERAEIAVSRSGDVELESQATFRFVLPNDGEYTVFVAAADDIFQVGPYVGRYRFQLHRIDRRPERAASAIVIGDTLDTEFIDYVGDVDEYQLSALASESYNAFIQRGDGMRPANVELEIPGVVSVTGLPTASAVTRQSDSLLLQRGVGRFTVNADGTVTIRVVAATTGPARGRYRLFVHRYDARPETSPAVTSLGGTIVTERIDVPGDEDVFRISVPRPLLGVIRLSIDPASRWAQAGLNDVSARLTPLGGGVAIGGTPYFGNVPHVATTSAFAAPPGEWELHVASSETADRGYVGSYQLSFYEILPTPEGRPPLVTIGDTVTEEIEPLGDVDQYRLVVQQGDHVEVVLRILGAPGPRSYLLSIVDSAGKLLSVTGASAVADSLSMGSTSRVTFAASGSYTISVGSETGANSASRGPYQFEVRRFPATPEVHHATIALGADVIDERIDYPGDVDEFVLRGPPGTLVEAYLTAGLSVQGLVIEVIDAASQAILRRTQGYMGRGSPGVFAIPSGGAVILRLAEASFAPAGQYRLTGSYRLEVLAAPP